MQRRKKGKGFKVKNFYNGGALPGITTEGYDNMSDGKSKSSPFQNYKTGYYGEGESSPIDQSDLFGPNKGRRKGRWSRSKWNPKNWFKRKNLSRKGTVMSTKGK